MSKELSKEDEQEFLAKCEEDLKHRFTENDKEYMKVFNRESTAPPIMENWWTPNNFGYRNERRNNRRYSPYEQHRNRDRYGRSDRSNRGYNDHNSYGYRRSRN